MYRGNRLKAHLIFCGSVILLSSLVLAPHSMAINHSLRNATDANPYSAGAVDPVGLNVPILILEKGKKKVGLTYKSLLAMHPVKVTIYEPFVKETQTFSVVPFATIFKLVGIKNSDIVVTTALNQFDYSNSASNFLTAKASLAFERGGINIPIDQGGPVRIIYPNSSSLANVVNAWNWSLSDISVKP